MAATIFEVLPTLLSRDQIPFDDDLREDADRTYYSSKIGPWTILPSSVAYFPLTQVASPSELAQLHKFAKKISRQTSRLQDELLAEQSDSNVQLRG